MNTNIQYDTNTNKFFVVIGGKRIESPNKAYLKTKIEKAMGKSAVQTAPVVYAEADEAPRFPINERFELTAEFVDMVAQGEQASVIITGEGGLGKTYTVETTLAKAGYINKLDVMGEFEDTETPEGMKMYRVLKGFSTAKGLYRVLFENRHQNCVVVLDDCDSVLKDSDAVNLLKGALDSSDRRWISWNSSKLDEELPRSFMFEGGVVFISNLAMGRIDQAVRSRSLCVDLGMTIDEKLERMTTIAMDPTYMPDISVEYKQDVLDLLTQLKDLASNVSMRTLQQLLKIRNRNKPNWKRAAEAALLSGR